jgi:hypothetical protein
MLLLSKEKDKRILSPMEFNKEMAALEHLLQCREVIKVKRAQDKLIEKHKNELKKLH